MTKFSRVSLFAVSNVTVYPRLVNRKTKIARNYLDHQEKKFPSFLEMSLIFVEYTKKAITFNWLLPSLSKRDL